jgi:hypothetical protein
VRLHLGFVLLCFWFLVKLMFLCILFSLVVTLLILTCMPCRYKRITKGKSCYNCQILSYTLVNITIFLVCESISHNLVNPSLLRTTNTQDNTIQYNCINLDCWTIQYINQSIRAQEDAKLSQRNQGTTNKLCNQCLLMQQAIISTNRIMNDVTLRTQFGFWEMNEMWEKWISWGNWMRWKR